MLVPRNLFDNFLTWSFFFFNPPATTEIYTLSLHDALPILGPHRSGIQLAGAAREAPGGRAGVRGAFRSEEHTSELQSLRHLVCRLLLEKKKKYVRYYLSKAGRGLVEGR